MWNNGHTISGPHMTFTELTPFNYRPDNILYGQGCSKLRDTVHKIIIKKKLMDLKHGINDDRRYIFI